MGGTEQAKADIAIQQRSKQNDHRGAVAEIPKPNRRHWDAFGKCSLLDSEVGTGSIRKLWKCFVKFGITQPFPPRYPAMFEGVSEPIREAQGPTLFGEGLRNFINDIKESRICFGDVGDFLRCWTNEISKVLIRCKV